MRKTDKTFFSRTQSMKHKIIFLGKIDKRNMNKHR